MRDPQGYSARQAADVVGISYRQIDYWARTELVTPSLKEADGSGTQRSYSFQDLLKLRVVKSLLDAGVTLQAIRRATDTLDQLGEPATGTTLISDGKHVYAEIGSDVLMDLLQKGQGVFALAVDRVWSDLERSVKKGRMKTSRAASGGS